MDRKIAHIDMDAFFASVEQLDNPALRGKPVIVGGNPRGRGVVSTCSYEARQFGVHSAQPLLEALRRCPQGVFLPVRISRYAEISRQIMEIFTEYTPLVEPLSLDEAFLDLTGSERIFGPAEEIARRIVNQIETEIGLTASLGLAPNKFLAKLGSDLRKPKGFVIITKENALEILNDLPIGKMWGVGSKTEAIMQKMGIRTIGMLRQVPPQYLSEKLGDLAFQLHRLAWGIDDRAVLPREETKSVGHEITFQTDTDDREFLAGVLLSLAEQVARRLRHYRLEGRIITLKIRNSDFKTLTRRTTIASPTDFEETIYREALRLAKQVPWGTPKIRLIGISVSGFTAGNAVQLGLFDQNAGALDASTQEMQKLHQAVDELKNRFGEEVIMKGTVLRIRDSLDSKRKPDTQELP